MTSPIFCQPFSLPVRGIILAPSCCLSTTQELGGDSLAFDFPADHLEHVADMSAHYLIQRERRILSRSNVFRDGMWGNIKISKRQWFPLAENQRTLLYKDFVKIFLSWHQIC